MEEDLAQGVPEELCLGELLIVRKQVIVVPIWVHGARTLQLHPAWLACDIEGRSHGGEAHTSKTDARRSRD